MAAPDLSTVQDCEDQVRNVSDVEKIIEHCYHLRRLKVYVEYNIDVAFQLSDAASAIGLSPSRVSHLFSEKTGLRYCDWIRTKRVDAALDILTTDDRVPILDVSLAVGYKSVRSFERAFKKTTGMTPTESRRITLQHNTSLSQLYMSRP